MSCLPSVRVSHLIFRCSPFQLKTKPSVERPHRQKQQRFLPLPCWAQLVDPNLATNVQLGMWLKPDALPSMLSTLNCTNPLPVRFPLPSFQTAAEASHGLSQEGFAGKAQLTQISQLHTAPSFFDQRTHKSTDLQSRLKTLSFPPALHDGEQSTAWEPGSWQGISGFQLSSNSLSFRGCGSEEHGILLSLLDIDIGFYAIQRINDLVLERQWLLVALVLPITIENVATEVCGEFYLQTLFRLKL